VPNFTRSKVSRDALKQDAKRTSSRYDPNCDGAFFLQKDRSEVFRQAVASVFNTLQGWESVTVEKIIDSPLLLMKFADDVRRYLLSAALDDVALNKLQAIESVDAIDVHGFSFCNHVAKRLLLCRKSGKLLPRGKFKNNQQYRGSTNEVRRVTGGAIIQDLS